MAQKVKDLVLSLWWLRSLLRQGIDPHPSASQWVKDLTLLWLQCSSLAQELPYAMGVAKK